MPVSHSEPYNEAAAAEKIKLLESEQEQNEQKLSDATEQVKVELLRLDATSPDIAMQFKEILRTYLSLNVIYNFNIQPDNILQIISNGLLASGESLTDVP